MESSRGMESKVSGEKLLELSDGEERKSAFLTKLIKPACIGLCPALAVSCRRIHRIQSLRRRLQIRSREPRLGHGAWVVSAARPCNFLSAFEKDFLHFFFSSSMSLLLFPPRKGNSATVPVTNTL